ncbi:MAG: LCP family protein [Ruminococcus sp.]|nr:LCP family protein [Ruminococcus sp.]
MNSTREFKPSSYKGKYEARPIDWNKYSDESERGSEPGKNNRSSRSSNPRHQNGGNVSEKNKKNRNNKKISEEDKIKKAEKVKKRRKANAVNFFVKLASIVLSLLTMALLVLHMPIFVDTKTGDKVSMTYLVKHWQPLVSVEGELNKSRISDIKIDETAVEPEYTDGLDLPQLVEGQYSVLLLGFDEDVFNTDVMWVCQFDIGHGKLNILQIPRDCCLPDYTTSVTGKINSVYSMGRKDVNPPIQRVVDAVQENFGIPIDAYITTVCYDIVDMVDLIGGIPIHIDNEIIYEADKIIPAGDIVLSGAQSEWFIRFRREWLTGDIGRMQNQRRFMAAAMSKLISIVSDEGRMKLYSYMKEIYDNEYIYTDMSLEDISMLADFASTLSMESVQVNMVPGEDAEYYAPDGHIYDVYSVHKEETLDMLNKYYRPYQRPMFDVDSSIVELVHNHNYTIYDDTSETLDDLQNSTEPKRDPNKAVK